MSFRHRIVITQNTDDDGVQDGDADNTVIDNFPCDIVPVNGGESYRGVQLESTTTIVIECRWYDGIKPHMQGTNKETNSTYYFNKVLPRKGRRRYLMIQATELTG